MSQKDIVDETGGLGQAAQLPSTIYGGWTYRKIIQIYMNYTCYCPLSNL